TALIVCIRFSACSNAMFIGDSNTSSVVVGWAKAHPTLSTHHSMRASFYFRSNHYDDFIKAIQLLI
ncbi:TPA: hypothetical protein ACPGPQ_001880, partial [Haemophilus influenzae]